MYKTVRVLHDREAERRQTETMNFMVSGWFPTDPNLLDEIKEKVRSGIYVDGEALLAEDLKADLSLLTHSLRKVFGQNFKDHPSANPFLKINRLAQESDVPFLLDSIQSISKHRIKQATSFQIDQLRHSILSCATSEVIAKEAHENGVEVNPEVAYSCAALRQLGVNLIAWNYARLYDRARQEARRSKVNIDAILERVLGISPLKLAAKVTGNWNLAPEYKESVAFHFDAKNPGKNAPLIGKMCEWGESFAQTNSPQTFPQAEKTWVEASKEISKIIGEKEIRSLQSKIIEKTALPLDKLEHVAKEKVVVAVPLIFSHQRARNLFESNHDIRRCAKSYHEKFRRIYDQIGNERISREALEAVFNFLVPSLGFARGTIFFLNKETMRYRPGLIIGDNSSLAVEPPNYLRQNSLSDQTYCKSPLLQEEIDASGQVVAHVSGTLGHNERPGVLLLELSEESRTDPEFKALLHFKAIRRTILDCLGITQIIEEQVALN